MSKLYTIKDTQKCMVFTKLSSSPPFFQSQVGLFLLTLHRSTYQVCANTNYCSFNTHPFVSLRGRVGRDLQCSNNVNNTLLNKLLSHILCEYSRLKKLRQVLGFYDFEKVSATQIVKKLKTCNFKSVSLLIATKETQPNKLCSKSSNDQVAFVCLLVI